MPLDADTQAFLKLVADAGRPAMHTVPVPDARKDFLALCKLAGPPESVEKVEDTSIAGPNGEIPIRIYTPAGSGPFPLLVYFHGGGWVIGSPETCDTPVRALTNRSGCVTVSIDYRLAPEHKFPAGAEDCYAATRWVADNAAALNGDALRLAVAGDSAGGNLAAVVPLMARDRGGPAIAFQLLIYPVTNDDFDTDSYRDNAEGYLLTHDSMVWYWGHYLARDEDGAHPYASPLQAKDLSGLPPAHVITAEYDPLRDEGEAYAERLRQAGVPVTLRRYSGTVHGFFQLGGMIAQGRQVIEDAGQTLRTALGVRA